MRSLCACIVLFSPVLSWAAPSEHLWAADFQVRAAAVSPVANAAFYPDIQAQDAPAFAGVLDIAQTPLTIQPELGQPIQQGRDARLFPAIRLEFFSVGGRLVPAQRGEMLPDISSGSAKSYWRVIAQVGRIWRVPKDGGWARASFPLMLVSGIENQAHQGLASFLYRKGEVTALRLQFVQQSAPYILSRFVAAGVAPMHVRDGDASTFTQREADWRAELAARLPAQPWQTLLQAAPPGALDDFGGPLYPKWRIAVALVRDGTLYYQDSHTDYGPYPYPLEMRFGVRSVMKSVGVPLSLLHLAQIYGPWVLSLKIGDYVKGLDPKWNRVRFIDAANMATGYGGTGTLKTQPNDIYDGYLEGDYDAWYLAPSQAAKIERINANLTPYPWEPHWHCAGAGVADGRGGRPFRLCAFQCGVLSDARRFGKNRASVSTLGRARRIADFESRTNGGSARGTRGVAQGRRCFDWARFALGGGRRVLRHGISLCSL